MLKRWLALAMALSVGIASTPISHAYNDLLPEQEGYEAVEYLIEAGVYREGVNFKPETYLTRANLLIDLVKLSGNKPGYSIPQLPFEDTQDSAWYAPYFEQAITMGLLDGTTEKAYPYRFVTQLETLLFLYQLEGWEIPSHYEGIDSFFDVKNTPYESLVMDAFEKGIFKPKNTDLASVFRAVPRLQAAQMLYQAELISNQLPTNENNQGALEITEVDPELQKFIDAWTHINTYYLYDDFDHEAVMNEALKALVDALGDEYSTYMDAEVTQQFFDRENGTIEGIGAVLEMNDNQEIVVISPLAGSPAESAGLQSGDIIKKVNNNSTEGLTLFEVIDLIKGPKDTTVTLSIQRGGEFLDIPIKRAIIEIISIQNHLLENGRIYHLDFAQFNTDADKQFEEIMTQFLADDAAKGMIIDLRGNPGGFLDVTVNILSHFVEYLEPVVRIQYKDSYQEILSNAQGELGGTPIVVLIDQGSASASEILAGVLQDYELATIVGEASFGKGTVQHIQLLSDGSSLKLTVARWITPHRQDIEDNGVLPDINVQDNPNTEADEALQVAINELNSLIENAN